MVEEDDDEQSALDLGDWRRRIRDDEIDPNAAED